MKQLLLLSTLFISFLLTIPSPALGEKDYTMLDLLCSGEWQAIIENAAPISKVTLNFTQKQQIYYLEYESKSGTKKYSKASDYHLSETPESSFDKKKVGKVTDGRYVITSQNKIYEIIILTSTTLKIKRIDGVIHEYHKKEGNTNKTFQKQNDFQINKYYKTIVIP